MTSERTNDPPESADAPGSRGSVWRTLLRWVFLVIVIVVALLFPVFILGIRFHIHPVVLWSGTEVLDADGIRVKLQPSLRPREQASVTISGTGFLTYPIESRVAPSREDGDDGATTIQLHGSNLDLGWQASLTFAQPEDSVTGVSATMEIDGETADDLTGTVLLNTLDWRASGTKTCVFALHSEWNGGRCLSGVFSIDD